MTIRRALASVGATLGIICVTSIITYGITYAAFKPCVQAVPITACEEPLERFRESREALYTRQLTQLNDIIYNSSTEASLVDLAQRRILELQRSQKWECTLEGMLDARGFKGSLVCVGKDGADIFLREEVLTASQNAVILDLIRRQTGYLANKVKIIPVK